jgi:hypothetical protein
MNLYPGRYKNVVILLLGGISNFQVTNKKEQASHHATVLVGGSYLSL